MDYDKLMQARLDRFRELLLILPGIEGLDEPESRREYDRGGHFGRCCQPYD